MSRDDYIDSTKHAIAGFSQMNKPQNDIIKDANDVDAQMERIEKQRKQPRILVIPPLEEKDEDDWPDSEPHREVIGMDVELDGNVSAVKVVGFLYGDTLASITYYTNLRDNKMGGKYGGSSDDYSDDYSDDSY